MNRRFTFAIPVAVALVFTSGCANQQQRPYNSSDPVYQSSMPASATVGTVDRIEVIRKGDGNNVAGTIIGGIVGGLIGHQIGGGSGQTAATIAGAVGGGVAGNQIEKRSRGSNETFRVTVRLDNGDFQTITEDNITDLRAGDRVRIDNGRLYRS